MVKDWLNTAIVGTGRQYFDGHEAVFKCGKPFAPIAIVDLDVERAEKAKETLMKTLKNEEGDWAEVALQELKVYESYDEMLEDKSSSLDFIDVITHTAEHIPLAIKALQRDISVQVEKPPGLNFLETGMLAKTAEKSKGFFQLAEHICFERKTLTMKKAMDSGRIGVPTYLEVNFGHNGPYWPYVVSEKTGLPFFIDPELGGGGCLQDLGPHGISQGFWLLPDSIEIEYCETKILERRRRDRTMSGRSVDNPVDDYAMAEFQGIDNATGVKFSMKATTSWCGHPGGEPVILRGSEGALKIGRTWLLKRKVPMFINSNGKRRKLRVIKDKYHKWHSKIRETTMFADNILQKKPSICGPEYAHKLQQVISLHYFSKMKGGRSSLKDMEEWGAQILEEKNGDWQKASHHIAKTFAKSVDIK